MPKLMFINFRPWLSKLLPFIILFILAFTYRDVLKSMILVPLAYVIFVFRLIAGSINQQTLWVSFVVLSSIIAFISLLMRRDVISEENIEENEYPTRLQSWINTVSHNEHSQYFKWNMAQDLSNLFIDVIAYKQGTSRQQTLKRLQEGNIDLPHDIIEFIRLAQKPFSQTSLSFNNTGNWLSKIQSAFKKKSAPKRTKSPLDINHQYVIGYIEDFLSLDTGTWHRQHNQEHLE